MFNFGFPWIPDFAPFKVTDQNEQTIAPQTNWLSPTIVTYAGDRAIEERIVTEVASFGRQLGILSEALLEIADGEPGEAVDRLRQVVTRVETVKSRFRRALEEKAEDAFMALLAADPAAAERLAMIMERRVTERSAAEAAEEAAEARPDSGRGHGR